MISLNQFINYKLNCPLCKGLLNLAFLFKTKNKIRQIYNNIVTEVPFSSYPLKRSRDSYTAVFNIDPENNSFFVDFLDKHNHSYVTTYLSIRDKYFSFLASQKDSIRFYKECTVCRKYNYSSTPLIFNHKSCQIENFEIMLEYFCLGKKVKDNRIKVYKLHNNYINDSAVLMCGKLNQQEFDNLGGFNVKEKILDELIETHAIKINSDNYEKIIEKLDLLLTFS